MVSANVMTAVASQPAVSGGSYTAAAAIRNVARRSADRELDADLRPLAPGSPEAGHIIANGRYLWWWRKLQLVGCLALNVLSLIVLYLWIGTMIADFAVVADLVSDTVPWLPHWQDILVGWGPLVAVPLLTGGIVLIGIGWYSDNSLSRRTLVALLGLAVLFVLAAPTVKSLGVVDWPWLAMALALLLSALVAGGVGLVLKGRAAAGSERLAVLLIRLVGLTLLLWSSVKFYDVFEPIGNDSVPDSKMLPVLMIFIGVLVAGPLFSFALHRTSPHMLYRRGIASCFDVVRQSPDAVEVGGDPLLSSLEPPSEPEQAYPRLPWLAASPVAETSTVPRR